MRLFLAALALLALLPAARAATLIHAGRIIDGRGNAPTERRTIVVEDGRIAAIERGFRRADDGDVVIDLRDATVMPGFMDMHVHIVSELSPSAYADNFRYNPADRALHGAAYARRTLMAGFTTVRDLGTRDRVALAVRDAIDGGWVPGPRIYAAGTSIATTGGHADRTNGVRDDLYPEPGPHEGVVDSVDEARKAVRARYKEGADLIKITATGGVLSQARSGDNAQFTIEEIEAIVATANDYGFHVAAHAHGPEGMRRAVLGGVTSIEHGTYMTDEIMQLMVERGTIYVPTIMAGRFVAEKAEEEGYFSDLVRPKAAAIGPQIQDTFARAYRAGVPIVFGTDTGVSAHGDNWKEFVYMVEAGMPALEAIESATSRAAALIGEEDRLGAIMPGMLADIVAVPGDPLEDIELMGRVHFVMKNGEVYKHED